MTVRKISFELNAASIDRAIREVEQYRTDLQNACQELAARLTAEGVQIAKMYVMSYPAIDTGELLNSINGVYDASSHVGIVKADAVYAIYVEYGTGVRGGENPHPLGNGKYRSTGWYYYNGRENKVKWTLGMPSRPFMYDTFRELQRVWPSIAANVMSNL